MRLELHGRVQDVQLVGSGRDASPYRQLGGRFFSEIVALPAGDYVARIQIMFSERAAGETIRLTAKSLADGTVLDRLEMSASPENRQASDHLYLRIHLDRALSVELSGDSEANCASTLLRFITIIGAEDARADPDAFSFRGYVTPAVRDLNCVIFGTTSVCNASCVHCPTNKEYRSGFPHGAMDWALFERIVTELAAERYSGWFLFGLFGEPLEDPLLEARLRLIKAKLPSSRLSIATNGGLYEPSRHGFLLELADDIGVHVEAITPEIYDQLMHPLKSERVFPRIVSLLHDDHENKVHITTPVHRKNLSEISKIKAYFAGYGAGEPHFTQIGNRSWESGPWAELALRPTGGFCFPDDLRTFVIDWDGAVLACCLDFSKSARLGDLRHQSVREVLASEPWLEMFEVHRTKNWARKSACSRCRTDKYDDVQKMIRPLLSESRQLRFPVSAFRAVPGATRVDESCIDVAENAADGIVIYGPYKRLAPGRYRVSHLIEVKSPIDVGNRIDLDIVENGRSRTAFDSFSITEAGPLELQLNFKSDGSITEFRVAKVGARFAYRGAIVQEVIAPKETL